MEVDGDPRLVTPGNVRLANPHKGKVKLQFFHGAQLRDPKKLFNAGLGGNKWRAIDFREGDKLNKPALKALLREAVAYNTKHAVAKSKGSRLRPPSKVTRKNASPAAKPVLLAGGNPQIAKGEGAAPVRAYITAMPSWKRDIGRQLDALIVRTIPGVKKAVKWNSPFYGVEGQGWFLSFHCFTRYVRVTFFRGTSLDPVPPGTSKHQKVRYLDIHEGSPADEAQLVQWIRQASALPGWVP